MHKLFYQPEGYWFGDCMPFGKDGKFYLFHQRDNRNPGPFGEPFGWALAVTDDFIHYEDFGDAIPRGADDEQDQFIFAGSVFEAEGQYHIFYTGYNRDYDPAKGQNPQVLMHAVSNDAIHWEKTGDFSGIPPQPGYDANDWRDPFVLWDDEKQEYLLVLGTRKNNGKWLTGCTVKFTSKDLQNWTFEGDFWAPDIFSMHEMPDLFRIGDWWYHIISEYSDKNKMAYRMSKSLNGPWAAPPDDAFDGRAYYAARTFEVDGRRILFGWVPTKENNDDKENWQWGGTFVPHEIFQREDGSLGVKPPETMLGAFSQFEYAERKELSTIDQRDEVPLFGNCSNLYHFSADVSFEEGTRAFGFKVLEHETTGEAYQFLFHVKENRFVFEKTPNQPWFQCMNIGLERPFPMEAGKPVHIDIIVDDTIAVLYANGVALCTRMYTKPGEQLSAFVVDGTLHVENATLGRI